jgi:hypothetical protein
MKDECLLCVLCVLCGENPRDFTTEHTETTEKAC